MDVVLRQVTAAITALRPDLLCIIRLLDREAGGYRLVAMGGAAAEGRVLYAPEDSHWSAEGHRFVAQQIAGVATRQF